MSAAHHLPEELRPSAGFAYVPALDGLRGVAILLVMAYHAFPATVHGGFLGVELFFVLSGFLITALLLREWDQYGGICLPYFYMRRVIRLLPALLLLLTSVTLVDLLVFTPAPWEGSPWGDATLSLAYLMNWARALGWTDQRFLAHTWSLSIEEQFYLLWPAAVLILCRSCPREQIGRRLLVMAGIVATYRSALMIAGASSLRMYNGLDTRADGLMLGSALAALLHAGVIDARSEVVRRRMRGLLAGALAALGVCVWQADWTMPTTYTIWLPVTIVSAAVLIGSAYVASETSLLRRVLESKLLVGAGRISYGLYLWHYPVYRMLGKAGVEPLLAAAVGTPVCVVLAVLSYRYVERPILRLKGRFSPAQARRGVRAAVS